MTQQQSTENAQIKSTEFTLTKIKNTFQDNKDVIIQTFSFQKHNITFISCEGMIDQTIINEVIYGRVAQFIDSQRRKTITAETVEKYLYVPDLKRLHTDEEMIAEVFIGKLLIFFHTGKMLFSIDIAMRPQRQPEEPSTEISIKGPRDGFVEDVFTNIALIRKRLRTNSLAMKNYEIGRRSKTAVSLLYIDDIANPEIIDEIDRRLKNIDIDGIYSGTQLKEILSEKTYNIFPVFHYSGRPDFAVTSLLNGRFILVIDGVQYALIAPINITFILKTAEDAENTYIFNSFERIVRLTALFIAILLPGFWVALSSFHQNQIPIAFLGTLVESRRGVPLPAPLEAMLAILLFEFFREAGLRLPAAIGSTLSVVGGLIIGDAAIRAGLTSPIMIVIVATSSVATFTLVSMSLHGIVSILRILVIIASSFFGLFGFFVALFFIVLSIANVRSFGVSYFAMPENMMPKDILKALIRLPESLYKTRPSILKPKDETITSSAHKGDKK